MELQKKKNDDDIDEGWVMCDACDGWVHQVCGLFNKGQNEQDTHFLCPHCLLSVSTGPGKDTDFLLPCCCLWMEPSPDLTNSLLSTGK